MKKIIIFGATGNIGVYFVDYCKKMLDLSLFEIIAVGRKCTDYFGNNGIQYVQYDLCSNEEINLPIDNVYAIVNLSGVLPAYLKEYNPYTYIDVNIKGGMKILEYARKCKADRIIYTQTWAEQAGYWGKEEVLSPSMPRNLKYTGDHAFYTITKCMIVDAMEYYRQEFGIKNFVFRLPNVYLYNPRTMYYVDGKKRIISYRYMIDKISKGEDIELWGDPNAFKDVLYVKDLCQMMYKALLAEVNGGIYNAGTGKKTTLKEQIEGMIEVFSNKKNNIIYKPDKPSFTSFVMDIQNAKDDLGYVPKYSYMDYLIDYKKEREFKRFDSIWL